MNKLQQYQAGRRCGSGRARTNIERLPPHSRRRKHPLREMDRKSDLGLPPGIDADTSRVHPDASGREQLDRPHGHNFLRGTDPVRASVLSAARREILRHSSSENEHANADLVQEYMRRVAEDSTLVSSGASGLDRQASLLATLIVLLVHCPPCPSGADIDKF